MMKALKQYRIEKLWSTIKVVESEGVEIQLLANDFAGAFMRSGLITTSLK
jgi:hypothetical protein